MCSQTLLGIFSALGSGLLWGLGSVCIKTQSRKMTPVALNGLRSAFGSLFFIMAVVAIGKQGELFAFEIPHLVALTLTLLFGFIISDTLFFKSIEYIDISRAFPIVASYPIFTVFLARLFLDEALTWPMLLGTFLVVIGAGLLESQELPPSGKSSALRIRDLKKGIGLAVVSSVCWGVAAVLLKVGLRGGDPLAAAALLAWGTSLVVLVFPIPWRRALSLAKDDRRFLSMVAVAGFLGGSGLAALLYVVAVDVIGAGQASVLTSTSPLFTVAIAVIFLHEVITRRVTLGTILTVLGVSLVVSGP